MKIRLNMTRKLALFFMGFAVLVLVFVGILAYTNGRSALEAATVAELQSTAIEKQAALSSWIADSEIHLSATSASPNLQEKTAALLTARSSGELAEIQAARDRVVAEMQVWVGANREYLSWMILDPQSGQVIAATDSSEEGNIWEDQPFFINGKGGLYVQNIYFLPSTQAAQLTVSAPILSDSGALLGVLAGHLDLENVNEIIIRRSGLRQSDDAFLVDPSHRIVSRPRLLTDPSVLLHGIYTKAVNLCLKRDTGTVNAPDYRGVPSIIVYHWLPEQQLCLIVKMDQVEALAPVLALRNNIFLIGILALLLAGHLADVLSHKITRPMQKLVNATLEIGAGKLDTNIELHSNDEIGQLAEAFVEMTKNLRLAQEQLVRQERLATLGQVAGSIGHELRNPLGVILNAVYYLKMTQLDTNDTVREYLDIITSEARTSDKIITDLLDFTRTNSLERETITVADLVQQTLERFSVPPPVEVIIDLPVDLPPLHIDPRHGIQVLGNLVVNAYQAMPAGGKLTLTASLDGDMIKLAVQDTGSGISSENMAKLFEPLFTTKTKGIGLGLAVSRKLVEINGGRIEVQSEPGQGSTFIIFLPTNRM